MQPRSARAATALVTAALLTGLTGCSGDEVAKEVAAMNKSNIQRLANLYSAFQAYKGGRGPKDEAEFKEFIRVFDAEKLTMMGVNANDLDGLFKSERDGKPFRIKYNVGGRGSVDAVIFEQEGQGGTKQVAYTTNTKVEDVDDATYQQLWNAKPGAPKGDPKDAGRPTGRPSGAPVGPK
jgi:hypothetical protein